MKLASTANMSLRCLRDSWRSMSTKVSPYPFSKVAIIPPPPAEAPRPALLKGKGLMAYLQQTLPTPEKQKIMNTLFSRRHPDRIQPGSVLAVTLAHAPTSFSGVLISVRRRGADTSFVLRNVVQRTGVEMQFFVNSPHLKSIQVMKRVGSSAAKRDQKAKKAKLFYLRDSPEKMSAISGGIARS